MATSQNFTHDLQSRTAFYSLRNDTREKHLLSSFNLDVHSQGFHPQTQYYNHISLVAIWPWEQKDNYLTSFLSRAIPCRSSWNCYSHSFSSGYYSGVSAYILWLKRQGKSSAFTEHKAEKKFDVYRTTIRS